MSYDELIFDEIYMKDMIEYLKDSTELDDFFQDCNCVICYDTKLLLVSLGITTKYAMASLKKEDGFEILAVTVKQNEKYFPALFKNLNKNKFAKPKFQSIMEETLKEIIDLV